MQAYNSEGGNKMIKIVVGGQMDKQPIAAFVKEKVQGKAEVSVMSDIEAAMAVKNGIADYYIGACSTGAGGALGIAFGLLGAPKCVSISTPAKRMSKEEIEKEVANGKIAFGFVNYDLENVVPELLDIIVK